MRRRSNNHFELGLELPGLRLARLVAVPLFHTPESAGPKTRATEGLILLSVSDTGCLGTRMDCTVLQMLARQSTEAPSQPSTGEGAGLATQNRKPTLHNSPTSCSTVPEKGSTQPGHTHWTPTKTCRRTGTGQVGRAMSACPWPIWCRHGSDPSGTARTFHFESGFSGCFLKGGRVAPSTMLLLFLHQKIQLSAAKEY